jgi:hypothetical protein
VLLNFTNAGIFDAATINDGQTVGNAQVSTTQAKWGTTSMGFDGTGDWLALPGRPEMALGTGDFTVEFWFYSNSISTTQTVISCRDPDTANLGFDCTLFASKTNVGTALSNYIVGTTTWSSNTWYHSAIVRSGSSLKLYINGTQEGSTFTLTTQNFTNRIWQIGNGPNGVFNGYIQDVRITNGYARYTANFTAPTAAFPTL